MGVTMGVANVKLEEQKGLIAISSARRVARAAVVLGDEHRHAAAEELQSKWENARRGRKHTPSNACESRYSRPCGSRTAVDG
ncbi:hypothetical protein Trco_006900 [Trichoderma cornu-damae]|uniref:Uncharacterized protein n=1 Tax=Trichoderma cornu-damae TaxID=654480 RepID=A0A9P8QLF8_9HYPO|nr:hypothetical protein Trco_006900 [Trichoderma cornu-damae]